MRNTILLIAATFIVAAVSLIRITPKVWPWNWQNKLPIVYEVNRVRPLLAQLDDPAHWDRSIASNQDIVLGNALRWRLLPPVVGRALHLTHTQYLYLPWIGWVILIGSVLYYSISRMLLKWDRALALGVVMALSAPGFIGISAVGLFHCWWVWLLVIAVYSRSDSVSIAVCLLGPWVDERFILILPAALMLRLGLNLSARPFRWIWYVAPLAPYILVRLVAVLQGDVSVGNQLFMQSEFWPGYWLNVLCGWWEGYRAGWLIIAFALWIALSTVTLRNLKKLLLLSAVCGYFGVINWLAWDSTANSAALAPFIIAGGCHPLPKKWLWVIAAMNVILPAAIWTGDLRIPLTSFLNR